MKKQKDSSVYLNLKLTEPVSAAKNSEYAQKECSDTIENIEQSTRFLPCNSDIMDFISMITWFYHRISLYRTRKCSVVSVCHLSWRFFSYFIMNHSAWRVQNELRARRLLACFYLPSFPSFCYFLSDLGLFCLFLWWWLDSVCVEPSSSVKSFKRNKETK